MDNLETGTIRQVHRYPNERGYLVGEYAIRLWVKQGLIPVVYAGRTAYISVANVRNILDNGLPNSAGRKILCKRKSTKSRMAL